MPRPKCAVRCCLFIGLVLASRPAPAQPQPEDVFRRWDRNQDGQLTADEIPEAARRNFERVDTDRNGTISLEEHVEFNRRNPANAGTQPNAPRVPDTVRAERDIAYAGTDHARQRLDLYIPKTPAESKLPLIVFIHGGGWQNGDKAGGARQVLPYVESGTAVGASIGYRLSGDATWPAQIHDCKAAIRWLRAHAADYGIDPERIGVIGTSAGGHLVAMLGTSGGVAAVEGDLGDADDQSSRVQCVVNFFGPADLLTMGNFPSTIDHNSPESPESKMLGGAVQSVPERAKEASPLTHVTADDAPFLSIHGTDDQLVPYDQSVQLDAALRKAGVPSLLIRVEGGGHGNFGNPEIDRRVRAFLQRHLLGADVEVSTEPVTASPRERPAP